MIPLDIVILRYFLIFETHEAIPIKVFHDRYQFPFYLWRIEAIPKYYKITKYHDHDFLKNGLNFSNDNLKSIVSKKWKKYVFFFGFMSTWQNPKTFTESEHPGN